MSNTVLIITDDAEDAHVIGETLQTARDGPFVTDWVRRLSEGIARLKQGDIDIILADLFLPDSKGILTFDALFEAARPIPIITLMHENDDELATQAVERGAQGYLTKGYFRTVLVPQALRNIIQRKRVEEALFVEKERARVTLESIGDGVLSTDVAGNVTYLNKEAERLTGWAREEAIGRPVAEILTLMDGVTLEPARNPIELVIQQGKPMGLYANSVLVRRDGFKTPIEDSVAPIFNQCRKVTGAVITFHDISEMKAMAEKMAYQAQHDYLTGLPNRVLFNDRLTQAISYAERHGTGLALLYLDLDNFKNINDSLGHAIGDQLLQSVAERLVAQVRHSDTVSRQGGDEFVILVLEDKRSEDGVVTAGKILWALAEPHYLGEKELYATASIGISTYPVDGRDADTLVKNADIAMYHAKEKGRSNYQFFKEEMNARAVQRHSVETDLRLALERDEFILNYQPKVNLKSGEITGVEALIRWSHPTKGLILPKEFIPIAEECGLIVPIGQLVLRKACAQGKSWLEDFGHRISIAVNISGVEFRNEEFFKYLQKIIKDTGFDSKSLELELTETVLMKNVESTQKALGKLNAQGVRIAVDDFGTGYSSLSYLNKFPISVLKIDKSFVNDISTKKDNGIIVNAVIGMGLNLGQKVVAEGVETQEQFRFLCENNCEEGQGYLFNLPLPAEEITKILNHTSSKNS